MPERFPDPPCEDKAATERENGTRNEKHRRNEIYTHKGKRSSDNVCLNPLEEGRHTCAGPIGGRRISYDECDEDEERGSDEDLGVGNSISC